MNEFFIATDGGVPPVLWLVAIGLNVFVLARTIWVDMKVRKSERASSGLAD